MRLLAYVALAAAILFALAVTVGTIHDWNGGDRPGQISAGDVLLALMALTVIVGIPVAYLVAIVRHGLWDLDVVIRKAAIALVVALVFGVVVGALIGGYLISSIGGGGKKNAAIVGVILGLIIVPIFRSSRRIANRVVYGRHVSPYEALASFSERVGETYADDDVLPRMARVLCEATRASGSRVLLRIGRDLQEAASFGDLDGDEHRVPVLHQGEELGSLAVSMPANDPMTPAKEKLVRDLATQAGPVLRNVRLIEELRASRQRLVAAQDDERRKLERNIHDGVQQQLVALAVKLKLADMLLDRDPTKAHEALAALQAEAGSTLDDLRNLARGIYPPLLADKGLVAALESQARKAATPTTVSSDGVERYSRDVEATVYFCTLEAMNNIAKYAGANAATVSLTRSDGHLTFTITDDGEGFDPATTNYGTGLQGMADRLDAIGGSLDVASERGSGTTVTGQVPVER